MGAGGDVVVGEYGLLVVQDKDSTLIESLGLPGRYDDGTLALRPREPLGEDLGEVVEAAALEAVLDGEGRRGVKEGPDEAGVEAEVVV